MNQEDRQTDRQTDRRVDLELSVRDGRDGLKRRQSPEAKTVNQKDRQTDRQTDGRALDATPTDGKVVCHEDGETDSE